MHAPVSTPMHVHSWQSREATRAWRPWGERNVRPPHSVSMQPCVGFKQHSNNYNRRVSLMTVGETDHRGDLVTRTPETDENRPPSSDASTYGANVRTGYRLA